MSSAAPKRARRERLASTDESKGGGFPLPELIRAVVHTVLDADEAGASINEIAIAVRAANANEARPQHVWPAATAEASFRRQAEDLVDELVEHDYLERRDDQLHAAAKVFEKPTDDGGYLITLRMRQGPAHRAHVWRRDVRERVDQVARERHDLNTLLAYLARPRLRQARVEQLRESIARDGYDPRFPIIRDGDGRTIAGHHREAAAAAADVDVPKVITITDPVAAVLAAFRDNDGRNWRKDELKKMASVMRADGTTQAEVAMTLGVAQQTISDWDAERAAANGKPRRSKGRPSKTRDPEVIDYVADQHAAGVPIQQIAENSKTDPAAPMEFSHYTAEGVIRALDPENTGSGISGERDPESPAEVPEPAPEPRICECCGQPLPESAERAEP